MGFEIRKAIFDQLNDDTQLTDKLGDKTTGGAGIYTKLPVPGDTEFPYVVVLQSQADTTDGIFSSKQDEAREISRPIRIFDDESQSEQRIEDIGERIFELFNNNDPTLNKDGWTVQRTNISGPTRIPTEENDILGLGMTLTLVIQEE